jgi:hypothetical protein
MLDLNFFNIKKKKNIQVAGNSLTLSLNIVQRLKFENSQLDSFPSPGMKLNYMGVTLMCDLVDMAGPKIKKKKTKQRPNMQVQKTTLTTEIKWFDFFKKSKLIYFYIYIELMIYLIDSSQLELTCQISNLGLGL